MAQNNGIVLVVENLTQLQLDGVTCAVCGQIDDRPMIPVGPAPSGLVDPRAHTDCQPGGASTPQSRHNGIVLVVGDVSDSDAVADLTAFAFDVASRVNRPARVALDMHHDVTEYEGVVLAQDWLNSVTSAVLGTEAYEAEDLCVLDTAALYGEYKPVDACAWCGEGGAAPVLARPDLWTPPMHDGCFAGVRRAMSESALVALGASK